MSHHSDESILHDGNSRPLVIIADDLTGACDSAVAFTEVADDVRVQIAGEFASNASVLVLTTHTRDLSVQEANRRLAEVASRVNQQSIIFKKVDSVFRGNTFAEIASSIKLFPAELTVIAPAYPSMGRSVHGGVLKVSGNGTHQIIHVADLLRNHGCPAYPIPASEDPVSLARELGRAMATGANVVLCDAAREAEMNAITSAVQSLAVRPLWIGSAGLAHALASLSPKRIMATQPDLPVGDVVFFIGSDHPVTRGQQLHLRRMSGLGSELSAETRSCIVPVPRADAVEEVLRTTEGLQAENVGCLFMTGGDTALAVCDALGITALRLLREFVPGVPLCVAEGGRFDGTSVILKSGGFGERDLLCRILDSFAGKDRAYA